MTTIHCNICNKIYKKSYYKRHLKTKIHLKNASNENIQNVQNASVQNASIRNDVNDIILTFNEWDIELQKIIENEIYTNKDLKNIYDEFVSYTEKEYIEQEKLRTEKNECIICTGDIDNIHDFINTLCGHKFHLSCINEWVKTSNTCPMCRKIIF